MRVLRVVLVQDGEYDPPVLRAVQALYDGDLLAGEFKVKDGSVLLDPLRVGGLGDDRDTPLDLPAKDYLWHGLVVWRSAASFSGGGELGSNRGVAACSDAQSPQDSLKVILLTINELI